MKTSDGVPILPEPIRIKDKGLEFGTKHNDKNVEHANTSPNAYLPVSGDVKSVHFKWARGCHVYKLLNDTVVHKGNGVLPYRPVIGDLAIMPYTGKYYYEIKVNCDNCRIGVCTENAYATLKALEEYELGQGLTTPELIPYDNNVSDNRINVEHKKIASKPYRTELTSNTNSTTSHLSLLEGNMLTLPQNSELVAYIDGQTSKVYLNGILIKHLWRLLVPAAGALFSFVVDTNEGVIQLFVDKKYAGLVFDLKANLKGRTLYPCVAIAGCDMHNRNIGQGNFCATISPPHRIDSVY